MSVSLYTIETVPKKKTYVDLMKNFLVRCYKTILNINSDIRINEKTITNILGVSTIDEIWAGRNLNASSHISRSPYDNPARIAVLEK